MNRSAIVLSFLGLLAGCAGVDHRTLDGVSDDSGERGVRYYGTSRFLLVYADGKGGIVWKILTLPDPTKLRTWKPYSFAASGEFQLQFDDTGTMLKSLHEDSDSTVVAKKVLDSIAELAPALGKALLNEVPPGLPENERHLPPPYLFKIVADAKGARLVGGQANKPQTIDIPMPQ